MITAMNQYNFVGTISRRKLVGGGRHAGVLLPNGMVAHMTQEGAVIVTFGEFAQGLQVSFDKPAPPVRHHQILWRAQQSAGRMPPYDLLNRNCEHYATFLMGEEPKSQQVTAAVVVGIIGAFLLLAQ